MNNNNDLIREKVAQATGILQEFDVDVWLTFVRETILSPDPVLEFIGHGVTWQSAFILTKSGDHTAIVGRFDTDAIEKLGVYKTIIGYDEDIKADLVETLTKLNPNKIAINYSDNDVAADGLSHGLYRKLLGYLDGSGLDERLISAENLVAALRGRKSPQEIERVRTAIKTTEKLFDTIEEFIMVGMTAAEVAEFTHNHIDRRRLGYAWEKSANPIVTPGPNAPIGHALPGDTPIEKGHLFHMDLGIMQNDYCSDLQRMWYVLKDDEEVAPPDVQYAFDVVYGALKAGESLLRPGVPGWQVDEAARDFVVDNGFAEYKHAFGHLLGRVAHDGATVLGPRWPKYAGICDMLVEVGNIFTLELHVVVPNRGIMSLEEDVLVTANGVEYLSTPQTELRYIRS